jgi:hypothetical protein
MGQFIAYYGIYMKVKNIAFNIITGGMGLVVLVSPHIVLARINPNIGPMLGLNSADLGTVVVRVIQLALGYLGLIAVMMILIGGFMWMTSAGNEERIASAKRMLSAAIVGTIIVMLSWAIVSFVVNTTNQVTR